MDLSFLGFPGVRGVTDSLPGFGTPLKDRIVNVLKRDNSSGALPTTPSDSTPSDDLISPSTTYRGPFSSWFNQSGIIDEDLKHQVELYDIMVNSNREDAQAARDFAERMSNTSYQRAVEDLKKAGLNPILAYSQGGASTPSVTGNSASMPSLSSSDSSDPINSLLSSVLRLVAGYIGKK